MTVTDIPFDDLLPYMGLYLCFSHEDLGNRVIPLPFTSRRQRERVKLA